MKETRFIGQNREKWERFEKLSSNNSDPEEVSRLFIEITNDLSYAKTHYPRRSVRVYLNNLAQSVFLRLNRRKSGNRSAFVRFWRDDLPLELFRARWAMLISLLVFVISMIIGAYSTEVYPDFTRVILGDDYVAMTEFNIERGDPMAVYKHTRQDTMFLQITINNIRVALLAFVMGFLLSIGTIHILVNNGIMVGTFLYFFYQKGLLYTSMLTIWIHGAFEISSIVVAGGAGIVLGSGIIFPGTYSRGQALFRSAKRGVRIMMGLIPIFIVAGFLESFVTRKTEMPDALKLTIIIGSFAIMLGYFFIYPYLRYRKKEVRDEAERKIAQDDVTEVKRQLLKPGEVFSMAFEAYRRSWKTLWKPFIAFLATGLGLWLAIRLYTGIESNGVLSLLRQHIAPQWGSHTWVTIVWVLYFGLWMALSGRWFLKITGENWRVSTSSLLPWLLIPLLLVYGLIAALWQGNPLLIIGILVLLPAIGGLLAGAVTGKTFSEAFYAMKVSGKGWFDQLFTQIGILIAGFAFFLIVADIREVEYLGTYINGFLKDILFWHSTPSLPMDLAIEGITVVGFLLFFLFFAPLLVQTFIITYWSNRERDKAEDLKERIRTFGSEQKHYE